MKRIGYLVCLAALVVVLAGVPVGRADVYVIGPAVDKAGQLTGQWVVYRRTETHELSAVSTHSTKDAAVQKAQDLTKDGKGVVRFHPALCDQPNVTC